MSDDAAATARILVYDGDCSMCDRLSKLLARRWLVGAADRKPHDAFEGDEARRLTEAGIHNELAVIDRATGEIRTGYDGITWLLRGGKLPWLGALLAWGPVRWLLRHDYRLVAYNRRIFAPPNRGAACACDPDVHRGYRWAFIGVAQLWILLFGALSGAVFLRQLPFGTDGTGFAPNVTWWAGPILMTGWLAAVPVARRLRSPHGLDALGHMAWCWAAALVPLLVAIFASYVGLLISGTGSWAFDGPSRAWLGAAAWGVSLVLLLRSLPGRLARLGFAKRTAVLVALVSWAVPTALLFLLRLAPHHVH